MMEKNAAIYVAGHRGMVGSAITRLLKREGYHQILTRSSAQLDLRNQAAVDDFFASQQIDYVFLAAARVGGIQANNTYRAEFIADNLAIELNCIRAAHNHGVKKLLFLGSSCIYPKMAPQPLKEEYLLSGTLEPTNEPYAIAKIAGIKLCEAYRDQYGDNFIAAMPTNLYGPNDTYDLKNSHVLPALIRKFHEAHATGSNVVEIWGSGTPLREFLHVDDLAEACLFLMLHYNSRPFVNVGTGSELSIQSLAELISRVVGFQGSLHFDRSKPDGTPRKLLDVSTIHALGWHHKIPLQEGIKAVYEAYVKDLQSASQQ